MKSALMLLPVDELQTVQRLRSLWFLTTKFSCGKSVRTSLRKWKRVIPEKK